MVSTSTLPTKLSVRRTAMISTTESKNETWLAAMIAGPVRGSCSPPSTRTRHRTWYSGVTSNCADAYTGPNRLLGRGAAGATILNQAGSLRHGPGESAESHQSDRRTEATAAAPTMGDGPRPPRGFGGVASLSAGSAFNSSFGLTRPIGEEVSHAAVSHDAPGVELRNGVEPARGDRPKRPSGPNQASLPSREHDDRTTVPAVNLLPAHPAHRRCPARDDSRCGSQRASGSAAVAALSQPSPLATPDPRPASALVHAVGPSPVRYPTLRRGRLPWPTWDEAIVSRSGGTTSESGGPSSGRDAALNVARPARRHRPRPVRVIGPATEGSLKRWHGAGRFGAPRLRAAGRAGGPEGGEVWAFARRTMSSSLSSNVARAERRRPHTSSPRGFSAPCDVPSSP